MFLLFLVLPIIFASDGFLSLDLDKLQNDPVQETFSKLTRFVDGEFLDAQRKTVNNQTGSFQVEASNAKTYYFIDLNVGTPPQSIRVMIDTGSADLWFIDDDNSQCKNNGGTVDCAQYGTFKESRSTSWRTNNTQFKIGYLDGDEASGVMGSDDIQFAKDFKLTNAEFAVVENTSSDIGVFGIGYPNLESTDKPYSNIPKLLKTQGIISKEAYSIYLNSKNSTQGYILFGGIDYAKFEGDLTKFDIVKSSGSYLYSQIPLTHVTLSFSDTFRESSALKTSAALYQNTSQFNFADTHNESALIDTGTTYTYLLQNQIEQLLQNVTNATYNNVFKMYNIPCSLRDSSSFFTFNFNNMKDLHVDADEFVVDNPQGGCLFTILPSTNNAIILGDNFLRSVFVVFDLEDNQISLAQAVYNNDHEIVPIE